MKNLDLFEQIRHKVDLRDVEHIKYKDGVFVYISGPNLCAFTCDNNHLETYVLPDISTKVLSIEYITQDSNVGIVTEDTMVLYNLTNREHKCQKLGMNIVAACWKQPCNSTVLLLTEDGQILQYFVFMNHPCWEPHCVASLHSEVADSVYVGWGARETQFKGNDADALYGRDELEFLPEFQPPTVSWRGNGENFVVNFWRDGRRYLRVYSSDCEEMYESPIVHGLLELVAFKLEGNMIATVCHRQNGPIIVIFEKNCCVRHQFKIPETRGIIKSIKFHPSLPLIAIHSATLDNQYLGIYFLSNGKWYLKQQLCHKDLIKFQWGKISYRLVVELFIFTKTELAHFYFRLMPHRHYELAVCAVVDGSTLHFTCFDREIIPPPMYSSYFKADNPINKVNFSSHEPRCTIIDSESTFMEVNFEDIKDVCLERFKEFKLQNINAPWNGMDKLLLTPDESTPGALNVLKISKILNFSLGAFDDLYKNDDLLAKKVTSFYIYRNHLLYTKVDKETRLFAQKLNKLTPTSRAIEQGGVIVCVTKTGHVVLQMPRGNLEVVSCELLCLEKLKEFIENDQWREAFHFIRYEKLPWNSVVEINGDKFLHHLDQFLSLCNSPSLLTQVCCELNVKNPEIIERIIQFIESKASIMFLPSLISVIYKYYNLKKAVEYLLVFFKRSTILHEYCAEAVKQLQLHEDPKDIFSQSALCYNLEFLTFIVKCCNFNPLEYEPQIEQLKEVSEMEKRFQLATWAGRKPIAAGYLLRMPKNTDLIAKYIVKNSLYKEAYEVCPLTSSHFEQVSLLYAGYLSQRAKHLEAGMVCQRVGNKESALEHFRRGLHWRNMLPLLDETEKSSLVVEAVAMKLLEADKVQDGVEIYVNYLKKPQTVVELLIKKDLLRKALDVIILHGLDVKQLEPHAWEYIEKFEQKWQSLVDDYKKHSARLQVVRYVKTLKRRNYLPGDQDEDFVEMSEIYSDTETSISRSSKSSSSSSRFRRKEEKKKMDLREGGKYEDIALIRQLHITVTQLFNIRIEFNEMVSLIGEEKWFNKCLQVQKKISYFLEEIKGNVDQIWLRIFDKPEEATQDASNFAALENFELLDQQFRKSPANVWEDININIFG